MSTYPASPLAQTIPEDLEEFPAVDVEYDAVIHHVRSITPMRIRRVRLRYGYLNATEWAVIRDFFDARRGRAERFTYVHPNGGGTFPARFVEDSLQWRIRPGSGPTYEAQVDLEEVP